jgi:hypothetical protein
MFFFLLVTSSFVNIHLQGVFADMVSVGLSFCIESGWRSAVSGSKFVYLLDFRRSYQLAVGEQMIFG